MDANTWATCYDRLLTAYQRKADDEHFGLYFELLKNVPGPVIRLAVDRAIKEEKFWPNPATLRDYCDDATKAIQLPPSACRRCHGSTWIDAPDQEHYGFTYRRYVRRCPECWVLNGNGSAT